MNHQDVAASIPFVFSIVLLFLRSGVRLYAANAVRLTSNESFDKDAPIVKASINLATHVYHHLGFFFGVLLSSVTCLSQAPLSDAPFVGAIGAASLLILLPIWVFFWMNLKADEISGRKGLFMKWSGTLSVVLQWSVTIFAIHNPATR